MNRAALKGSAKQHLTNKWGIAIIAFLIVELVNAVPSGVSYYNYFKDIPMDMVTSLLISMAGIFIAPITIGYNRIFMDFHEEKETSADRVLYGFTGGRYIRNLVTLFLVSIFTGLWTLLFIIPGIIKAFSYAMTPFILADPQYDTKSPTDAITESRYLMAGHKMELFILMLSFIGWGILVVLTFGLLIFYVGPYMQQTIAEFYYEIADSNRQQVDPTTDSPKEYDPFAESLEKQENTTTKDKDDPFYY